MRACDILTTRPAVTVSSRIAVSSVANLFAQHGFIAMPIIDHAGDVIGVVSEADLIRNEFAAPQSPLGGGAEVASDKPAATVDEVMTSHPETVGQDAGLGTIADIVLSGRRRSIPVVNGRRVVGVVTRHDILPFETHVNQQMTGDHQLHHADRSDAPAKAEGDPVVHRMPAGT